MRTHWLSKLSPAIFNAGLRRCEKLAISLCTPTASMLDVGCGDGAKTLLFAEALFCRKITGLELFPSSHPRINIFVGDANKRWPFPDESFDTVVSSQNIEHVYEVRNYLDESYRVIKPGGQLCIMTENLASIYNIASLMMGYLPLSLTNVNGITIGNPLTWHSGWDDPNRDGHIRILTPYGLKKLLQNSGFTNVVCRAADAIPLLGDYGHFIYAHATKSS